jgi:hypothetical protein
MNTPEPETEADTRPKDYVMVAETGVFTSKPESEEAVNGDVQQV